MSSSGSDRGAGCLLHVAHDAEYIASYVNQVDGYPLPNGQTALQLAMQCIQGDGKAARNQHIHAGLWSIGSAMFRSRQSPGSGDAFSPAWRQPW